MKRTLSIVAMVVGLVGATSLAEDVPVPAEFESLQEPWKKTAVDWWRFQQKGIDSQVAAARREIDAIPKLKLKSKREGNRIISVAAQRIEIEAQLQKKINGIKANGRLYPSIYDDREPLKKGNWGTFARIRVVQVMGPTRVLCEDFVIDGINAKDMVDDAIYDISEKPYFVEGTYTYATALGASRTVLLIKPLPREAKKQP